ncbi:unnamed protein product, partial [marine sediment metagenome]
AEEMEALASEVPDTGGVSFVPAFVGLGAPYWDPFARGAILGLDRGTKRAHIARAALEAIAFQSRDVLEAMHQDADMTLAFLKCDGGAAANNLLMQFQADILGTAVQRPVVAETTALGAAYLAGLAGGYWFSADEVAKNWALDQEFQPNMPKKERNARYERWKKAVERSRSWVDAK